MDFQQWCTGYQDGWQKSRTNKTKVITSNKEGEIWHQPWLDDLMQKIENNEDIEEFIKQKNQKLIDDYTKEQITPLITQQQQQDEILNHCKKFKTRTANISQALDEFSEDVNHLLAQYPPEKKYQLRNFLSHYAETGNFEDSDNKQRITRQPNGFWEKLKKGSKIKKANAELEHFIQKYQDLNLPQAIEQLEKNYDDKDITNILKNQLKYIADTDKPNAETQKELFVKARKTRINNTEEQVLSEKNRLTEDIQRLENSIKETSSLNREDNYIRQFATEIKEDIKNPKPLKVSDYIENLENMADDEKIFFNIGLSSPKSTSSDQQNTIRRIMQYNGLDIDSPQSPWLLRQELSDNVDNGRFELFSPVMTAKEAKEIMPKLIADMDKAKLTSSLVVPVKMKDFNLSHPQKMIPDINVEEELKKTINRARISNGVTKFKQYPEETQKQILEKLNIESVDKLPKATVSLDEISKKYSKDKHLFSGTVVSDDYFMASSRIGRNGVIYATPDINYATKYDGATNIGYQDKSVSATGDKYISTQVAKINDTPVHIGFINIYEQNPDDQYFTNFGMEEARKELAPGSPKPQVSICELKEGYWVDAHQQTSISQIGKLSHDQAVNGYIDRTTAPIHLEDKEFYPLSYNSETFINPDKNPLKAKIMHISMGNENYYIEVPKDPDKFTKFMLENRQADISQTYNKEDKRQIYDHLVAQQRKAEQGNISPLREANFWEKKKAAVQKANNTTEKTTLKAAIQTTDKESFSTLGKADNAINKVIDKTIEKGSNILNNSTAGKVYEGIAVKVSETQAAKTVGKVTSKVGEKVAKTTVAKSIQKVVTQTATTAVGKSVLKKIPVISAVAGSYFAYQRLKEGDWKSACGEMASGVFGCFPGLGTAASAAIDVGLASNDIYSAVNDSKKTSSQTDKLAQTETSTHLTAEQRLMAQKTASHLHQVFTDKKKSNDTKPSSELSLQEPVKTKTTEANFISLALDKKRAEIIADRRS